VSDQPYLKPVVDSWIAAVSVTTLAERAIWDAFFPRRVRGTPSTFLRFDWRARDIQARVVPPDDPDVDKT
jgi:hypothetical protein